MATTDLVDLPLVKSTDHITVSVCERPNFLNIPPELRRLIYQHFLQFDAEVDLPDEATRHIKVDLTLLQVCKQMRGETVEYLADSNPWVTLAAQNSLHLGNTFLGVPHLHVDSFSRYEIEEFLSRSVLNVRLSQSRAAQERTPTNTKPQLLFCHSLASQTILGRLLASPQLLEEPLTVNLTERLVGKPNVIADVVLPLTRLSNLKYSFECHIIGQSDQKLVSALTQAINKKNSNVKDFEEHLLSSKEQGNKMVQRGHYNLAMEHYRGGCRVSDQFSTYLGSLAQSEKPQRDELNAVQALRTDLNCALVQSFNTSVDRHRDIDGRLKVDSIDSLTQSLDCCDDMFFWIGMSGQQRANAHFQRAIAKHNFAEYLTTPANIEHLERHPDAVGGNVISFVDDIFKSAASDYFFAWQADKTAENAKVFKSLYDDMCVLYPFFTERDPDLAHLHDVTGYGRDESWTGDPALVIDWMEERMRRELPGSVNKNSQVVTREHLERVRRYLGLPEKQEVNGLFRLLSLGVDEETVRIVED